MARRIVQDLIVSIQSSAGWKYPLARMLVAEDGAAAVFTVRGAAPAQYFDIPQTHAKISAIRGEIHTTTGATITYRRRGASCGWKLAKCNVKTPSLARLWPEEVTPIPATLTSAQPTPTPTPQEVRAWAKSNGVKVAAQGRIPRTVIDAYRAAHELI